MLSNNPDNSCVFNKSWFIWEPPGQKPDWFVEISEKKLLRKKLRFSDITEFQYFTIYEL